MSAVLQAGGVEGWPDRCLNGEVGSRIPIAIGKEVGSRIPIAIGKEVGNRK
jgi:hypothetical protein